MHSSKNASYILPGHAHALQAPKSFVREASKRAARSRRSRLQFMENPRETKPESLGNLDSVKDNSVMACASDEVGIREREISLFGPDVDEHKDKHMPPVASSEASSELTMHADPASGRTYSHNMRSGSTRWLSSDADADASQAASEDEGESDDVAQALPDLERHTDSKTGTEYTYNPGTGSTRWLSSDADADTSQAASEDEGESDDVAQALPDLEHHTDSNSDGAQYERHQCSSTRAEYQHNLRTGSVRWL